MTSLKIQNQLRKTAIEAAHVSGKVLMKYFQKKLEIREKKDAGLVTNADLESQDKCMKVLKKGGFGFDFLTEEEQPTQTLATSPKQAEGRWIIDPLDGTTNYVHGFPWFCVSIGAEYRGELSVGVIYLPVLDETFVAVKNQGATVNGKKIQVSQTRKLTDALLTTGFTYRKKEMLKAEMDAFAVLSRTARAIRRPGAAAIDLAYTARGVFDGFWERKLSPWDVAAGILLVTEAGGKVTNFQGDPFSMDQGELLAANPRLHQSLLKTIQSGN